MALGYVLLLLGLFRSPVYILSELSLCLLHEPDSSQPFLCGPHLVEHDSYRMVTVFSATLTWTHVIVVGKVLIVETEIDCHSLEIVLISIRFVKLREFT